VVVLPEVKPGAPGPGPLALPSVTWSVLALATGPGVLFFASILPRFKSRLV
jgi:hypothetical protein